MVALPGSSRYHGHRRAAGCRATGVPLARLLAPRGDVMAEYERDLRVALLAVRSGAISPDSLIAALRTCEADRTHSLGRTLVEQGAVTAEEWSSLEGRPAAEIEQPVNGGVKNQATISLSEALGRTQAASGDRAPGLATESGSKTRREGWDAGATQPFIRGEPGPIGTA